MKNAMEKGDIILHPKFGLNPTMVNCYYCGEPFKILVVGNNTKKFEEAGLASPEGKMAGSIGAIDDEPCDKCKEWMKKGIILISIRDGEEKEIEASNKEKRLPDPYRTGKIVIAKEAFIEALPIPQEEKDSILKRRVCFVPEFLWKAYGIPEEPY